MKNLALAVAITSEAFKNTLDKGGHPYILHCIRVMMNTKGDECTKCAAMMHDLVEDTDETSPINYTFEVLEGLGFSDKTVGLLKLLTHDRAIPYMEYIKTLSISEDATEIKSKDLEDNSNITRLKGVREKDFERLKKYSIAYLYLTKQNL